MRWAENRCPECGEPAYGVLNQIVALVNFNEADGTYDWTGETDLDSQGDFQDEAGRELLTCDHGHTWWSKPVMEYEAVLCPLCGDLCRADTAHLHQGKWIGDECCWDNRLKASE